MASITNRSLTGDLNEGSTDGSYKKIVQNRGGTVDESTYVSRRQLDDTWYGLHEAPIKVRPDGKVVRTPEYEANSAAHLY